MCLCARIPSPSVLGIREGWGGAGTVPVVPAAVAQGDNHKGSSPRSSCSFPLSPE